MPRKQRPFWSLVVKGDGCWEWQAARTSGGYGTYRHDGRTQKAHRIAYTLACGPITTGMVVCHRCDNPPCCNPAHLFLGTVRDNNADRASKSRSKGVFQPGHDHPAKDRAGEQHWCAKLTSADVQAMRVLRKAGVGQAEIAAKYSVNRSTVSRITRGEWRKEVA